MKNYYHTIMAYSGDTEEETEIRLRDKKVKRGKTLLRPRKPLQDKKEDI